jgi:3-oxoacyl-[acyl-carrier-protein] synthase I
MRKWIGIKSGSLLRGGVKAAEYQSTGAQLLSDIYHREIADWPKFFKMDGLSKLGFLCSELLLREEGETRLGEGEYRTDRAVLLFGRTSSLSADRNYQQTIDDPQNYFPSPATFVYTLPNIVTGEISIRNHYRGETTFHVLEGPDAALMASLICDAFQDDETSSVLFGWLDCSSADDFKGFTALARRGETEKELEEDLRNIL